MQARAIATLDRSEIFSGELVRRLPARKRDTHCFRFLSRFTYPAADIEEYLPVLIP